MSDVAFGFGDGTGVGAVGLVAENWLEGVGGGDVD
ncbi:MAG UNVERIFIED_CONTAM: strawberry notch family protein [Planctomycetaceae bacterium]